MDEELRAYLTQMETRMLRGMEIHVRETEARLLREMDMQIHGAEDRMATLVAGEVGNLQRELETFRQETREHLARIDGRLDRQGFMLSGGIKALSALTEHITNVESNYERVLSDVGVLRSRIEKLEKAS